jgi:hypothetical protein
MMPNNKNDRPENNIMLEILKKMDLIVRCRDSAVGIATGYWPNG